MASFLQLFLSAVLTGGFALGGVWLTQRSQRSDKEAERVEARRALLRSKAEQIYNETETVQSLAYDAVIKAGVKVHQPAEVKQGKAELIPARFDRLKALVHTCIFQVALRSWTSGIATSCDLFRTMAKG